MIDESQSPPDFDFEAHRRAAIDAYYRRKMKRSVAAIDAHVEEWVRDNPEKWRAFEQAELEGTDEETLALQLAEIDRRAGRLAPYGTTQAKEGKS